MKRIFRVIVILFLIVSLLSISVNAEGAVPTEVLDAVDSVVRIVAEYPDGYATGTGFVIQSDSSTTLIATNHHVIEDNPKSISIWTETGSKIAVTVFVDDPERDLCILKLPYPNAAFKALVLDETGIQRGDAVYAVGFPGAADDLTLSEAYSSEAATITDGIISAIRTTYVIKGGKEIQLLQSTAPINHGNSGGPLFNSRGYVVGVNTYSVEDSTGIYGAISIGELIDLAESQNIPIRLPEDQQAMPQEPRGVDPVLIICVVVGSVILIVAIVLQMRRIGKKTHKQKDKQNRTTQVPEEKPELSTPPGDEKNDSALTIKSSAELDQTPITKTESLQGEILYEDNPNVIISNIPVLIEKVTLIKDSQTGSLAAKCFFRSLTDKPMLAMLVDAQCTDIWGTPTESIEGFQFLDLKAKRDATFGQDNPIPIPDAATRFITVKIKKIIYSDRTLSEAGPEEDVLPGQKTLAAFFGSEALAEEFVRETGVNSKSTVTEGGGYWRCTCGAINTNSEDNCYFCNASKAALLALQDISLITSNLEIYQAELREKAEQDRLEKERLAREAAARDAEILREKKAKQKKKTKRFCFAIAAILLCILVGYAVIWHIIPFIRYSSAETALNEQRYDDAYEMYLALDSYKDSAQKAKEALYQKGCLLMDSGNYTEAAAAFSKISDYKDSLTQATFCNNQAAYFDAAALFDAGKYAEAAEAFRAISDISDSAERAIESDYAYAQQLLKDGRYEEASAAFEELGSYKSSKQLKDEADYLYAIELFDAKDYENAVKAFRMIPGYKDVDERVLEAQYNYAIALSKNTAWSDNPDWNKASSYFYALGDYKDSRERYKETFYQFGLEQLSNQDYYTAIFVFESLGDYEDSKTQLIEAKYGYVVSVVSDKDLPWFARDSETIYKYLCELVALGYKDSKQIYSELYK